MKTLVQRIVDQSSVVAAGLGVVLSPFPLLDEALLLPVLGTMTVRIGRVHGLSWRELPWNAIAKTALGGLVARATLNLGVSYIPFVAAAANAASAATLTGAFGAYADRTCDHPAAAHSETLDELKVDVRELADRWRRICSLGNRNRDKGASGRGRQSTRDSSGGTSMSDKEQARTDPNAPAACAPVAAEVRSDIERSLRTRHFGHRKILFAVEDGAKTAGAKAWERFKQRPYAGIAVASAVGFGIASLTGVGELAVAVLCGYGAYEVLRRGQPVSETVEEMVKDVEKMA
jgi:uncharacterized protein (DUF697 family)/ElaB/YqjD/DUF883 family membrane-anchored ribosome-binding protein